MLGLDVKFSVHALFLLQGKDFGLDIGADGFDFLDGSVFFKVRRVIPIIDVELMLEMVLELKDLLLDFMVFGNDLFASVIKGRVLLRGDGSGFGKLLIELNDMLSIINLIELEEIAQEWIVLGLENHLKSTNSFFMILFWLLLSIEKHSAIIELEFLLDRC